MLLCNEKIFNCRKGDYLNMFDNINVNLSRFKAKHSNRESALTTWPCAYCKGTGKDPAGIMGIEKCPACYGNGWWEAEIAMDRLLPCGHCEGSGRIVVFGFL
jgi:DnaJ-class molecular chaperone